MMMRSLRLRALAGFIRTRAESRSPAPAAEPPDAAAREMSELMRLPLRVLVWGVGLAGLALTIYGFLDPSNVDWKVIAALAVLAVVAERADLSMYGDSRVSLAFVPIMAAIIISGMTGLAIVVLLGIVASGYNRPMHKNVFNLGALMTAGAASHLVFRAFGQMDYTEDWPRVLAPAVLAGGANFLVNSALVAAAIAISTRSAIRSVWNEHFMWLWPHYLVLAVLSLAFVAAYEAMGFWGLAVFLAPPIMMRISIKQYLDRTTESVLELRQAHGKLQVAHEQLTAAMDSLGQAYDGTLRSLVKALDARDSETAGHSERVADLTMAIAAEMGIPQGTDEWRYISWGALLHDVGKIAIPDEILRKPGGLTKEEWDYMRTHPYAGWDILQSVAFLAPAADIVLAHHERYDGGGYPRGLAGEQIPLGSRIFMIADTFDAMTSDRTYRSAMSAEEALAEILRNSGTQFDPEAVRAFLSVYQKRFVGDSQASWRTPRGHEHRADEISAALRKAVMEAAGLDGE